MRRSGRKFSYYVKFPELVASLHLDRVAEIIKKNPNDSTDYLLNKVRSKLETLRAIPVSQPPDDYRLQKGEGWVPSHDTEAITVSSTSQLIGTTVSAAHDSQPPSKKRRV